MNIGHEVEELDIKPECVSPTRAAPLEPAMRADSNPETVSGGPESGGISDSLRACISSRQPSGVAW